MNESSVLLLLLDYVLSSEKNLDISVVSDNIHKFEEKWLKILEAESVTYQVNEKSEYIIKESTIDFFDTNNKEKVFSLKRDILICFGVEWGYRRELMIRTSRIYINI